MKTRTLFKIKQLEDFGELSEKMGVPRDDIDYVAKLGTLDLICDEIMNPRCFKFDWARAEKIVDELSGLAVWKEKRQRLKLQAARRKTNYKRRRSFTRFQKAAFEAFPTGEIFLPMPTDEFDELPDGEIVSCEFVHPTVEYWSDEARTDRRREATKERVTKHRKRKKQNAKVTEGLGS